jgi:hypothetical protein
VTRFAILAFAVVPLSSAHGADLTTPGSSSTLEVHGFVSQGGILSTHNNYLVDSEDGSLEFSEAAINFTMPLSDRLRVGMQLFARDLGPIGDYKVLFDWYYLDYRFEDWLGIRAGRVKLPFGLYNDTSDVDAARTPILLPQSIYPTRNRDFLLAQTGVELYGYLDLWGAGALDYRLNAGTIFLDVEQQPASPISVLELTIPYVVGGRLFWELPVEGLKLGGSVQALRLDTTLLAAMDPMPVEVEIPAVLWIASLEYAAHEALFAAEYSRWHVDVESSNAMLFPPSSTVSERTYAMASYRVRPWFQPGAYYSLYYPNVDQRKGRQAKQHDAALTLRFDLGPSWILKLEGHYMHGTADLSEPLNDNTPKAELEPDWGLFLVKTTAYF